MIIPPETNGVSLGVGATRLFFALAQSWPLLLLQRSQSLRQEVADGLNNGTAPPFSPHRKTENPAFRRGSRVLIKGCHWVWHSKSHQLSAVTTRKALNFHEISKSPHQVNSKKRQNLLAPRGLCYSRISLYGELAETHRGSQRQNRKESLGHRAKSRRVSESVIRLPIKSTLLDYEPSCVDCMALTDHP